MAGFLLVFLWQIAALALTTFVSRALQDRPRGPAAGGLGDFVVPTADEGRVMPVICGTVHMKGPNVMWYGDFSKQTIQESGVTVAYKYSLSVEATLCNGPLDDVIEIRFDDRSIGLAGVDVTSSNNKIIFGDTFSGHLTANIPVGNYLTYGAVCKAAQDEMNSVFGVGTFQMRHGFEIQPTQSELVYAVKVSGVALNHSVNVTPGYYENGAVLAAMVAAALNGSERALALGPAGGPRVNFVVTYDGAHFLIRCEDLGTSGIQGWYLRGIVDYWGSLLPTIGFQMGADFFNATFPTTLTGDFAVSAKRFVFARSGHSGKVFLSDINFTAKGLFGITSSVDQLIEQYSAELDVEPLSGVQKTDYGEYWGFTIIQPGLFGGNLSEGGIVGSFEIYKGTLTQIPDPYLESLLGDLPAYRGFARLIAGHAYWGTSTQLKAVSVVGCRWPNQLGVTGGKERIGDDANPACFLYEILTNDRWGAAMAAGSIDATSFTDAATTLFNEGLGVSFNFDRPISLREMIAEVERHIDGIVYPDPRTGKMRLKLARADYVLSSLPTITIDNADEIKLRRPSWGETKNAVKIRYLDRSSRFTERIAQAQELANIVTRGVLEAEQYDFTGFSTAAAAQIAAARLLMVLSYPLARIELPANRVAHLLGPADVFKLTVAPLGITDMVCRVTQIRGGELGKGQITIDAVEDVFGVSWTAYTAPPLSAWEDPIESGQTQGWGSSYGASWGP